MLLALLGGLSLTEATGVTNLRATVIRIFTPDGTLTVEVDDPAVKVTIEGDGGIVIIGADAALNWVLENHDAPCGAGVPATTCPPIKARGCAGSTLGDPITSTMEVANGITASG